jgi:hypothetical protein
VTRDVPATVLSADGDAVAEDSRSQTKRQIAAESLLTAGESLRTAQNAQADVALVPGALLNLEGEAEIRLDTVRITKNGNRVHDAMRRNVRVTITRGTVFLAVQFESEGAGVSIATPHGVLTVTSPALYRAEVRDDVTRITAARGMVHFHPSGAPAAVLLEARSVREWPNAGSEQVPADFDIRATEEIEKSLVVEQKLLGLEHRRRLNPYPWRQ